MPRYRALCSLPLADSHVVCPEDLLNRHQRRCKTGSRVSKQKACSACVRTKSRCCFTRPACHRCLQRGEPCEYSTQKSISAGDIASITFPLLLEVSNEAADQEIESATVAIPEKLRSISTADTGIESTTLFSTSTERDTDSSYWTLGMELLNQSPTVALDWSELHNFQSGAADGPGAVMVADELHQASSFPDAFSTSEFDHRIAPDSLGLHSATKNISHTLGLASEEWNTGAGHHSPQDASLWSTALNASAVHGLEPAAAHFRLLASVDDSLLGNGGTGQFQVSSSTSGTPKELSASASTTVSFSATSRDAHPSGSEFTPATTPSHSSQTSSSTKIPLRSPELQRILLIVSSYPKLLLNEDYRSPFIHHKLHRGHRSDMTLMTRSNMAILCCASAHGNKGNAQYIAKAIAAEREHLVHEFVSFSIPSTS